MGLTVFCVSACFTSDIFQLNLVSGIYRETREENLILVHIGPI